MPRQITYSEAIREAIELCMERDSRVFIIGEGVPDPKGIFGTTLGLKKRFGGKRVLDMPVSENGLTGVCIGAAISGLRPILTHQRIDFSLLSFDQIVNAAAKWYYMFGGKTAIPLVIRVIIGRGWGQGAQHSQSLQALYAHIPGLKVVMPSTPHDAKGLLIASVLDNNPVIFIEHRWLHSTTGSVPEGYYLEKLGSAKLVKKGRDITLVSTSYMIIESLKAAKILEKNGISAEVIDVRTIKPFDKNLILSSVKKTGRLMVADHAVATLGFSAEVISTVVEEGIKFLKSPPVRVAFPDIPTPTSSKLAEIYYPTYLDIVGKAAEMMLFPRSKIERILLQNKPAKGVASDVPDPSFTGPF